MILDDKSLFNMEIKRFKNTYLILSTLCYSINKESTTLPALIYPKGFSLWSYK